LVVRLEPSNATNQSLVWSSSNHSVASVDSDGVVTAKGAGKARITVRALGFSSSCDVTVTGHYIPTPPTINPSTDEPIVAERQPIKAKVGDYIKFGKYEQDNDFYNGSEEIEWKVLAIKDGRALIISKYGLEAKAYDDGTTAVTWENCKLREWLNLDFYNLAFDEEEKTRIPVVTVTDYENPEHGTDPGNSTNDKVFLLSINEAKKYFSSDDDRQCKPTVYAEAQGVWIPGEDDEHPDKCWWWLRSPGDRPRGDEIGLAATVNRGGWINYYGNGVEKAIIAVRPAIWIELN